MFWGISLENGKKYSQVVNHSFHVTMAALEPLQGVKKENLNVTVMIEHQKLENVLCTLNHVKCLQQTLDLNFIEGEEVIFYTIGQGTVHMTGYHMLDMDSIMEGEEDSDDSVLDEEDEDLSDDEEVPTLVSMNGKDFEVSDSDDQDWVNDKSMKRKKSTEPLTNSSKKQKLKNGNEEGPSKPKNSAKKLKNESEVSKSEKRQLRQAMDDFDDEEEGSDDEEEEKLVIKSPPTKESTVQGTPQSKKGKKQQNETIKVFTPKQSANESLNNSKLESSGKKLAGGTTSTDIKIGNGPVAKKGKTVHVYYTGTLANGKEFDKCLTGKPFKFRLGSGHVIKGWDLGLEGMRIGGRRKLVVPPSQGYGNKKQGPIPCSSTLHFDVELRAIS